MQRQDETDIQQIAPGVYTGTCMAVSGEKVYLRMEMLTKENSKAWHTYKLFAGYIAGKDESITSGLADSIDEIRYKDGTYYQYRFKDDDSKKSLLTKFGYTESEFHDFVQVLGNHGIYNTGKRQNVLEVNSPEYDSWYSFRPNCYIVSASKTPDFQIQSLPIPKKSDWTVKAFIELYKGLLMSVGSDLSFPRTYENRSIFRNPYSVIENTFKGLAMGLHGFTGAVAQQFFPKITTLNIRPAQEMGAIIKKTLPKSAYIISEHIQTNNEDVFEIKVSALAELYQRFSIFAHERRMLAAEEVRRSFNM